MAKRLALGVVTLLAILLASYLLVRLAPGDPTRSSMLGEGGDAKGLSAEKGALAKNQSMREKLHLDKPVAVGFLLWLKGALLHGDLGASVSVDKGRPVGDMILERLPVTMSLNAMAVLITYLLAVPLGIHSAMHPESRLDKFNTFMLFLLYSLPALWTALLFQALLCKGGWLAVFPLKGLQPELKDGMGSWEIIWRTGMHYVLPVACLTYGGFAGLARFTRAGMLEVLRQDYIRTARAKGLPEGTVILGHAFRNALIIMVTLFAGLLPGLVSGSILVEFVFNIPGMGSLSMLALSSRDIPLMMALFAFGGALTLGSILVADVLYVVVDPRIGFESRG